jgi:hypothetical protein
MDSRGTQTAISPGTGEPLRAGAGWRAALGLGLPIGGGGGARRKGRRPLWAAGTCALWPPVRFPAGPGCRREVRGGLRDGDPSPRRPEPDVPPEPEVPPEADPMPEPPGPEAPQPMDPPQEEEEPSWMPDEPELPAPDPAQRAGRRRPEGTRQRI